MTLQQEHIDVFTDGSCHTQKLIGAWVALILINGERKILQGIEHNTTHHRMELVAVLKSQEFIKENHAAASVRIITDSQYVTGLLQREAILTSQNFMTKSGKKIANDDLVIRFYKLLKHLDISFIKVKAHQQNADVPYGNREVDLLSRSLVRQAVQELT
ncbi:MAG: RNase H family protein [Taibaiella sp.]|jgi:ribonuclease HI